MKILVIGSKGFIGLNCVEYFNDQGHDVLTCDISPPSQDVENYTQLDPDKPDFDAVFQKNEYDVCINASGAASVAFSMENPEEDYRLNVTNVKLILDAISSHNFKCKFINFSSAAVYGNPQALPINEDFELKPLSPYGEHKLQSEEVLKEYNDKHGLRTCSMRVFSVYGPGLKKQVFWDVFQKSSLSNTVELFGTGKETRDFIYIDDLTYAIDCVIKNAEFEGDVINVASGVESLIIDVVSWFIKEFDASKKLIFSGVVHEGNPDNWCADITKLKKLGFKARTNLELGLTQTARQYKSI